MSQFAQEYVFEVPPKRTLTIVADAVRFLAEMNPRALQVPTKIMGAEIRDFLEFERGVAVLGVRAEELGRDEAWTVFGDPVQIWMELEQFELLDGTGPYSRRGRVTLTHEAYHAIEHAKFVRAYRAVQARLPRRQRQHMPAYLDPEWQAYCFAGCVLMPPAVLKHMPHQDTHAIARAFDVSASFTAKHLARMRRAALLPTPTP
jgi:hypothetical protein